MRFSLAILFAASLVSAVAVYKRQNVIPACASTCAGELSPSPCNGTDIACQCLNPNYTTPLTTCVQQTCNPQEAAQAGQVAAAQCKAAGVDTTNPVPACALPCDKTSPNCPANDIACTCKDSNYISQVFSCVHASCTGQDLATTQLVGEAECRAVGVDITPYVGA